MCNIAIKTRNRFETIKKSLISFTNNYSQVKLILVGSLIKVLYNSKPFSPASD